MFANTHFIQWLSMGIAFIINVGGFFHINAIKLQPNHQLSAFWRNNTKHKNDPCVSWTKKRNAYWILMTILLVWSSILDAYFPIDTHVVIHIKLYLLAFPICLLDLYFSDTQGNVPSSVFTGATLYCGGNILRQQMIDSYEGNTHIPFAIVQDISFQTCLMEFVRFIIALVSVAFFSDLVFSPLHRLSHTNGWWNYQKNHKKHHQFTDKLTSLVLYHGTIADDAIMAFSTVTIGSFAHYAVCTTLAPNGTYIPFSNVTTFLMILSTHLSHSHDIRCAKLLGPVPDNLNFVAYHYVHHLNPNYNFGLTEPSDILWDWILGVQTIRKFHDFSKTKSELNKGDPHQKNWFYCY